MRAAYAARPAARARVTRAERSGHPRVRCARRAPQRRGRPCGGRSYAN